MEIPEAFDILGVFPPRDIEPKIQAKIQAAGGQLPPQSALDEIRDEVLDFCRKEFKKRAKLLHPDLGGDIEEMQKLNAAMDKIKELQIILRPPAPPPMMVTIVRMGGMWGGGFTSTSTTSSSTGGFSGNGFW
jgi:hypothetical protein